MVEAADLEAIREELEAGGDGAGGDARMGGEAGAGAEEEEGEPAGSGRERRLARRGRRRVARDDDPGALTLRNAKAILLGIPSFAKLLWRLVRDPRVSRLDRALFAGALVYVLSPVDLVPDWLAFVGQLDDLVLIALVLSRLLYRVDEDVLLEHWEGALESLEVMEGLLHRLVDALPWWARRLV